MLQWLMVFVAILIGLTATFSVLQWRRFEKFQQEWRKSNESIAAELQSIRDHLSPAQGSGLKMETMEKNLHDKVLAVLSDIDIPVLQDTPPQALQNQISGLRRNLEFKELCGAGLYPEDYLVMALDYYFIQDIKPALAKTNQALALNPDLIPALQLKGIILGELGQHEEALKIYEKILEINPNDAGAWYYKGISQGELNQRDAALQDFEKVIALDTSYTGSWYNMACIYARENDKTLCLANLQTAIQYNPTWKDAAKNDADFRKLWDDEEFMRITQE
jgi:tetratricopeptide (TPR) repeat protein